MCLSQSSRVYLACAAAGLFVLNSDLNRLGISARYLVSNSAESWIYIVASDWLVSALCLVKQWF